MRYTEYDLLAARDELTKQGNGYLKERGWTFRDNHREEGWRWEKTCNGRHLVLRMAEAIETQLNLREPDTEKEKEKPL